ncbi:Uncharacterised protein [Mycobacteroides abscessus subsp. massiliense]|nr:Uncharacterised protein [Mycobacteroides abscessus subsp. massiliense]
MAVDSLVRVDHPRLGRIADGATTDEMRRQRDVHRIQMRTARVSVDLVGHTACDIVGHRDPVRIRFSGTLFRGHLLAEHSAFEVGGQRVVQRLHHQHDDGVLRGTVGKHRPEHHRGVPQVRQPGSCETPRAAVDHIGAQHAQERRSLPIPDHFDMGVGFGVD